MQDFFNSVLLPCASHETACSKMAFRIFSINVETPVARKYNLKAYEKTRYVASWYEILYYNFIVSAVQ